MFYEKAVANAEWMFSGIPAGSGADLSEPHILRLR